ncbi:hypothetical protein C0Q70_09280 [Pomacea canaliculata]|uniref:EGF-like domain-containing protein n=1 Tax=Pomacea canaliculata TaxID=400727 RepID=A0A2T7P9C9_POMCA|nr:uncharacterized protein LOC112564925 isoform X2 [Pomacea canaliculata]XP_025095854.1 uncharacterized protein LOC112564925 isoform X2 [Pomacea canaliculata]XP_025095855.1 uncharacterized protein LOC112564925 isoform X2 [Pomacea canaliculata]PVD30019.1 hypothetical protein C0Q70_09280 [Pomacea canaliculata]
MRATALIVCFDLVFWSNNLILSQVLPSSDSSSPRAQSSEDEHVRNESLATNNETCPPPCARKLLRSSTKPSQGQTTGYFRNSGAYNRRQPRNPFWIFENLRKMMDLTKISVQMELRDIARFLVGHKYFGFDPRTGTEITWKYSRKGFYAQFPKPPLKDLHEKVVSECSKGFVHCVRELAPFARRSYALKNFSALNLFQTNVYYPFSSALELFRFRTTASYFLCWHTMQQNEALWHIAGGANCLHDLSKVLEPFGQDHLVQDIRTDSETLQCALLVFCPDPCYGTLTRGSVISADFMSRDPGNPCRGLQDKTCKLDFGKNLNFNDLQRNRFNISCQCAKEREGFQWNSQYHLCVDTDECFENQDLCGEDQMCQNEVGSYTCLCKRGYILNNVTGKCEEHYRLPRPKSRLAHQLQRAGVPEPQSFFEKQLALLLGISAASHEGVTKVTMLLCLATAALAAASPAHTVFCDYF